MAYGLTVTIEKHVDKDWKNTPAGRVEYDVEHAQYRVFAQHANIATPEHQLHVGFIGTQPGANFCPILAFYEFAYPQQQHIVEEAKRLHGNASPTPHVEVPPPPVVGPDDVADEAE